MIIKYKAATMVGSLLLLILGREAINKTNLIDNGLGPRKAEKIECRDREKFARSDDGRCNDLESPLMGASEVPLGRNVRREDILKENERMVLEPNPIAVSRELLRRDEFKPLPLNLLLTTWIQFMNHDWFDHHKDEKSYTDYFKVEIPLKYQNEFRQDGAIQAVRDLFDLDKTMVVPKTKQAGTMTDANGKKYEIYSNRVTHWWDSSQVYGSNAFIQSNLRTFTNGKMLVTEKNLIPLSEESFGDTSISGFKKDVEKTGFISNWWTGLSMLHNLFVQAHNMFAADKKLQDEVKAILAKDSTKLYKFDRQSNEVIEIPRDHVFNSQGTVINGGLYNDAFDQAMFDKARLITSAIAAKIHTVEWTPAVIQTTPLDLGMRTNWFGLLEGQADKDPMWNETFKKLNALAKRTGVDHLLKKSSLAGLVGGNKDLHGVPFSISEEFTSVYRMHSLLPDSINILDKNHEEREEATIAGMREEKSKEYFEKYDFAELFYSFGHARSGQLTLTNFPKFLTDLEVDIVGKLDIGAIDVLRDRERGVPRYNQFRRAIGLDEIVSFADLFSYTSDLKPGKCVFVDPSINRFGVLSNVFYALNADDKDRVHCKLLQMNKKIKDFKELLAKLPTFSGKVKERAQKELDQLKDEIKADMQEREEALTPSQKELVAKMRTLYNSEKLKQVFVQDHQKILGLTDNVDALDLLVGSLAETFRHEAEPERKFIGFGFGETAFQIFILMASRRLQADRFYTESFNAETYTKRGIDIVNNASMKSLLVCSLKKQMPEIEKALKCTRTAFHPWNNVNEDVPCEHNERNYEKRQQEMISFFKSEICK